LAPPIGFGVFQANALEKVGLNWPKFGGPTPVEFLPLTYQNILLLADPPTLH
jgi:hypothetical protein